MRCLKKLEREEKPKTVSEVAEVEVNEQEVETEEVDHQVEDVEQLDLAWVEKGRNDEMEYMV